MITMKRWVFLHSLLYIMLHKVALTSKTVDKIPMWDHSKESMLYEVVLTFETVNESLCVIIQMKVVLSYGAVYYAVWGGSKFQICG